MQPLSVLIDCVGRGWVDAAFVGMGSILMEGSYVEGGSMLAANTVLLPHTRVPSGQVRRDSLAPSLTRSLALVGCWLAIWQCLE